MKRQSILFLFVCLLTSALTTNSQTIAKLDEKNGFKDFKLGDTYETWSSNLTYVSTTTDGEKRYTYTGTCCQEVFTTSVQEIDLLFSSDNKLVYITIFLKPYQDYRGTNTPAAFNYPNDNYELLVINFKSLFGAAEKVYPDNSANVFYSNCWAGSKVVLITSYYFYSNYDYSRVTVMNKDYYTKKKESGF